MVTTTSSVCCSWASCNAVFRCARLLGSRIGTRIRFRPSGTSRISGLISVLRSRMNCSLCGSATADVYRADLHHSDHIDDVMRRAEPFVRQAEPVGENAVLRDAI